MKKIFLLTFLVAIVLLNACKTGNNAPPKVVLSDFFDAVSNADFNTARKLSTVESQSMMDMLEKNGARNKKFQYDKSSITLGEATITNDSASVPVTDKKSGAAVNFPLKKEGGAWKVDFTMRALMGMSMDRMKGHMNEGGNGSDPGPVPAQP